MITIQLLEEYIKLLEVNVLCAREHVMHPLDSNTGHQYYRSRERIAKFRNEHPQFRDHRGYKLDEED